MKNIAQDTKFELNYGQFRLIRRHPENLGIKLIQQHARTKVKFLRPGYEMQNVALYVENKNIQKYIWILLYDLTAILRSTISSDQWC